MFSFLARNLALRLWLAAGKARMQNSKTIGLCRNQSTNPATEWSGHSHLARDLSVVPLGITDS